MVKAISNKELENMRALNEMRRKRPTSGQEAGLDQRKTTFEEESQTNQKNFPQEANTPQQGYKRRFGQERKNIRNGQKISKRFYEGRRQKEEDNVVRQGGISAKSDFEKRDALNARRSSLRNNYVTSKVASENGKYAMAKSKINVAKRKVGAASDITKDAMVLAKSVTNPISFFSLLGEVNVLKDIPYIVALMAAGFDDFVIDWSGLTIIAPGTGSAISSMLIIFMGFMYLMALAAEGGHMDRIKRQMLRRLGLLLLSTLVEIIPVLDILPTEFSVALFIYVFLLAERNRSTEHEKKEQKDEAEKEKTERKEKIIQKEPQMAKAV